MSSEEEYDEVVLNGSSLLAFAEFRRKSGKMLIDLFGGWIVRAVYDVVLHEFVFLQTFLENPTVILHSLQVTKCLLEVSLLVPIPACVEAGHAK